MCMYINNTIFGAIESKLIKQKDTLEVVLNCGDYERKQYLYLYNNVCQI